MKTVNMVVIPNARVVTDGMVHLMGNNKPKSLLEQIARVQAESGGDSIRTLLGNRIRQGGALAAVGAPNLQAIEERIVEHINPLRGLNMQQRIHS